jgi:hypothetical protein
MVPGVMVLWLVMLMVPDESFIVAVPLITVLMPFRLIEPAEPIVIVPVSIISLLSVKVPPVYE